MKIANTNNDVGKFQNSRASSVDKGNFKNATLDGPSDGRRWTKEEIRNMSDQDLYKNLYFLGCEASCGKVLARVFVKPLYNEWENRKLNN